MLNGYSNRRIFRKSCLFKPVALKVEAGAAADKSLVPAYKPGSNTSVEVEKAALEKIGQSSANSADLSTKPSGTVLQQQAEKKIGDLATQFNDPAIDPKDIQLSINGRTLPTEPEISIGAPVFRGATDAYVTAYFKQLSASETMPTAKIISGKFSKNY